MRGIGLAVLVPASLAAQASRAVYLDGAGVVRWRDDRQEVTLFGANDVLPTASDYRAPGYLDHAVQSHPALRLQLARRALGYLGAGLRPALRQGP